MRKRLEQFLPCAVCFGASDNPRIPLAYTWGIIILLGFTFLILGTFVASIIRLEARRNAPRNEP